MNTRPVFGALAGALISALVALVPTVMDWYENPGGIFRGESGTHWVFVAETWWSWAWPLALLTVPLALGIVLLQSRFSARAAADESGGEDVNGDNTA